MPGLQVFSRFSFCQKGMESKYKKNSNDKILEFDHEQSDPRTLAVDSKEVLSGIEDCMPNGKLAINRIESRHSPPLLPL